MRHVTQALSVVAFVVVVLVPPVCVGQTPQQILRDATRVIAETKELKLQAIPDSLLKDAQAVAIVPNVVKIGLIIGGRHGHGIVIVREPDGAWSKPTFVELSGGSVGWQVGVQSTDVVLVFKNRQGIESLLQGNKFTLGADAAVAAGPIGRQASAATDEQLRAEVFSYSRSRGLFAGVSLDGSVLSVDNAANAAYAEGGEAAAEDTASLDSLLSVQPTTTTTAIPTPAPPVTPEDLNITGDRQHLLVAFEGLKKLLDKTWREYLTPPPAMLADDGGALAAAQETLKRYDRVAADERYEALTSTEYFQTMHALLGRYVAELQELGHITLPPPPAN